VEIQHAEIGKASFEFEKLVKKRQINSQQRFCLK
jgi:hypothetical protein